MRLDQLKEHTERVMERWQQEVSRLPFPAHYRVMDGGSGGYHAGTDASPAGLPGG